MIAIAGREAEEAGGAMGKVSWGQVAWQAVSTLLRMTGKLTEVLKQSSDCIWAFGEDDTSVY